MGVRVAQMPQDHVADAFGVAEDIIIPEAKHFKALTSQKCVSAGIDLPIVLAAIHLDHQQSLQTSKIHDVGSDRKLATESKASHVATTKLLPESTLSIAHGAA